AEVATADARDLDGSRAAVAQIIGLFGGIDVLVNTVGPFPRDRSVTEPMYGSDESWATVFDTVFMTAVRVCREVIPALKSTGAGRGARRRGRGSRAGDGVSSRLDVLVGPHGNTRGVRQCHHLPGLGSSQLRQRGPRPRRRWLARLVAP